MRVSSEHGIHMYKYFNERYALISGKKKLHRGQLLPGSTSEEDESKKKPPTCWSECSSPRKQVKIIITCSWIYNYLRDLRIPNACIANQTARFSSRKILPIEESPILGSIYIQILNAISRNFLKWSIGNRRFWRGHFWTHEKKKYRWISDRN